MSPFVRLAAVAAALLSVAHPAFAESTPSGGGGEGTIAGTLIGEVSGAPVPGATVTAYGYKSKSWWVEATATTDASGSYSLTLPVGAYKLGFQAAGYFEELFEDEASGNFDGAITLSVKSGASVGVSAALLERSYGLVFSGAPTYASWWSQMFLPGEGNPAVPFETGGGLQPIPVLSTGVRMTATLSQPIAEPCSVILYRYVGTSWTPMWAPTVSLAPGQTVGEVSLAGDTFQTYENLQVWGARSPSEGSTNLPVDVRVVVELAPVR